MKALFISIFALLVFKYTLQQKAAVRYVALGDSYTICTGATAEQSWPVLLAKHLNNVKTETELIANPSHNGWTTQDLIDRELPVFDRSGATFATVLIGVNDWVQGVDAERFHKNLIRILDHVQAGLPDRSKLILITIPDFGVTPTGSRYSGGRNIAAGISEFNAIILEEAQKRSLKTVDLFAVSQQMGDDRTLVAGDGLHPSAKEYAVWETLIYPVAADALK